MKALDISILKKAAEGDIPAFEEVMRHFEKLVYNIAFRMLSNSEDAQDILQEVFVKIYKSMNKCQDLGYFKSWLCKITTNACIDELRKRRGQTPQSLDAVYETENGVLENQLEHQAAKTAEMPEETLIRRETRQDLLRAIDKLSHDDKALIVLRDIQGFTYAELADTTELNLGTVKSRLSRARSKLKDIFLQEQKSKVFVIK